MTLTIDDYMPFNTTTNDLAFAEVAADNALWGPLLEKGVAKLVGNYWHMDQGINSGGISLLNGGPHYYLSHYKTLTQSKKNEIWDEIKRMNSINYMITAKSSYSPGLNIVPGHSYVVIDLLELDDGERLLFLRNPWGSDNFDGPWSDFDALWTNAVRRQRGIPQEENDGLFYISLDDYIDHMDYTYINYDVTNFNHAYFMMWDDPAPRNGNLGKKCGP